MLDLTNAKSNNFGVLPAGKYVCNVTEAKMADTKAGNMMLKVTFTIADGDQSGRKIFDQYVVEHANPKVVEIAHGKIKSLMENGGHANPNKLGSTEELEGLRVGVKTKVRSDENYGDKAEVSYFFRPEKSSENKDQEIGF